MFVVHLGGFFFLFFFYIFSALSSTSQFLISRLLSPDVFPNGHTINVNLLDLDGDEEELHQLKNELEHQALPLLHQVQSFGNFIFIFFYQYKETHNII